MHVLPFPHWPCLPAAHSTAHIPLNKHQKSVVLVYKCSLSRQPCERFARDSDISLHDAAVQVCLRMKFYAEVLSSWPVMNQPDGSQSGGGMSSDTALAIDQRVLAAGLEKLSHKGELREALDGGAGATSGDSHVVLDMPVACVSACPKVGICHCNLDYFETVLLQHWWQKQCDVLSHAHALASTRAF